MNLDEIWDEILYPQKNCDLIDLIFGGTKSTNNSTWSIVKYSGDSENSLDTFLFKCPHCGAEFNNRSEYCGKCGKKVE